MQCRAKEQQMSIVNRETKRKRMQSSPPPNKKMNGGEERKKKKKEGWGSDAGHSAAQQLIRVTGGRNVFCFPLVYVRGNSLRENRWWVIDVDISGMTDFL